VVLIASWDDLWPVFFFRPEGPIAVYGVARWPDIDRKQRPARLCGMDLEPRDHFSNGVIGVSTKSADDSAAPYA
jgi:hypothetical protein